MGQPDANRTLRSGRERSIIFIDSPTGNHRHDERTKEPERGQEETRLDPEGKAECEKIEAGRKKYPGQWQAELNATRGRNRADHAAGIAPGRRECVTAAAPHLAKAPQGARQREDRFKGYCRPTNRHRGCRSGPGRLSPFGPILAAEDRGRGKSVQYERVTTLDKGTRWQNPTTHSKSASEIWQRRPRKRKSATARQAGRRLRKVRTARHRRHQRRRAG